MERRVTHLLVVGIIASLMLYACSARREMKGRSDGPKTAASNRGVTYERLNADREPHNWLMYYGNYRGWRYSSLSQINTTNVKRLALQWAFQTGPNESFMVTPLVADGIMYIMNDKNHVFALDAATGKLVWSHRYERVAWEKMPTHIFGAGISRGVSLAGQRVLMGTWDAHFIALDAQTGKLLWKVKAGDYEEGYTFTSPPLILKDKAIIGLSPTEFPTRGFIDAYEIETGKLLWRSYTIPGPGEPENETWGGDSWKYGCAAPWMPGTYDPELNLVYIGTGNPCPALDGEARPGDNLYSSSILALDPDTGKLRWHFQTTPHDVWDHDAASELVLVDTEIQGKPVKALLQANKNGFFYAFERTNGRLLYAKPFISRINWTKGLDATGRPIPDVVPTPDGAFVCPSTAGAKSWNQMAYSPQTGHVYVPAADLCMQGKVVSVKPRKGVIYFGGETRPARRGRTACSRRST